MLDSNKIEVHKIALAFTSNADNEVHLFDREIGRQVRHEIEEQVQAREKETVHFVSFSNICSIDYSCADELVGKLLSRLLANEYGQNYFVLENLNSNHHENIQVVLDHRKFGCLERIEDKSWNFLGHRTNSLLETLNVIMEKGAITARELMAEFQLELTTSSTRLSHLFKAHLVSRDQVKVDGGGMEYLYKKLF